MKMTSSMSNLKFLSLILYVNFLIKKAYMTNHTPHIELVREIPVKVSVLHISISNIEF